MDSNIALGSGPDTAIQKVKQFKIKSLYITHNLFK